MEILKKYYILENSNFLNSDGICDLTLTKNFINLENVTIKTNLKKKVKSLTKGFKFDLYYNNILMKKIDILGDGTFGKVYLYRVEDIFLTIKINHEGVSIDDEFITFKKYLPKICKYSIIPLKIIKDKHKNPFVIMQLADGDLSTLKLSSILKIKIIITIAKALECFLKKNVIYMDLKLENILYKCVGNRIAIYLGDIGSLVKIGEKLEHGEIVVPESASKSYFVANEAYLLYTFGIFILEIYNYKLENMERFFKDPNINHYIKALVYYYTTEKPKKRLRYNLKLVNNLKK